MTGLLPAEDTVFFPSTNPFARRGCQTRFDPFEPIQGGGATAATPAATTATEPKPASGPDGDRADGARDVLDQRLQPYRRASYPGVDLDTLLAPERVPDPLPTPIDDHAKRLRAPFEDPLDYRLRPAYLPDPGYQPLIDARPRPPSAKQQAVYDLIEKEAYRQIRRLIKKHWRGMYKSSLEITPQFYQSRLTAINQIGKDADEFDPYNVDQYYNETRNDALRGKSFEGEKEIVLLEWGPLKIDDHGSVSFNPRELFDLNDGDPRHFLSGPKLATDDEETTRGRQKPLFKGKFYKVHTKLKVNFNPLRALRYGDPQETITSYGAVVEVDFYSDILKRELFTTEFEAELDRDGRWGVFFNIVLRGRR